MEKNHCLECGSPVYGRSDKKFCDGDCRNAYNNKVQRDHESYITALNKSLRRNRKILKNLAPIGKSTLRKEVLDALGYDFNVFSSMYRTEKGNVYYLCYDYGFCPIVDAKGMSRALIIQKQDYMGDWKPWKYVKK